jgi:hypothetical protein
MDLIICSFLSRNMGSVPIIVPSVDKVVLLKLRQIRAGPKIYKRWTIFNFSCACDHIHGYYFSQ